MAINETNITSDNFWLNMAAEAVYSAAQKRSKSVENLKTAISWGFGLFSISGFVIALFGPVKEYDSKALICFGIAFAMLTVAYIVASNAEFPVMESFNTNVTDEIKNAFSETVKKQTEIFKWAAGVAAVAFFLIVAGILVQTTFKKEILKPVIIKMPPAFIKAGFEKNGKVNTIPVTIMADKTQPITLSFINATKNPNNLLFEETYYTDSIGRLYYSYKIPTDSIKSIAVRVIIKEKQIADTVIEHMYTVSVKTQ